MQFEILSRAKTWETVDGWKGNFVGVHQEGKNSYAVTHLISGVMFASLLCNKKKALEVAALIDNLPFDVEIWANLGVGVRRFDLFHGTRRWVMATNFCDATLPLIEAVKTTLMENAVFRAPMGEP